MFSSFYMKGVGLEVMVVPEVKQRRLNCFKSQLNNLMKSVAFLTKKRECVLALQVDVRNKLYFLLSILKRSVLNVLFCYQLNDKYTLMPIFYI